MVMEAKDLWEFASFVVTVVGLPFAIIVFIFEQRKERTNEEEEEYQLLADAYIDFLKIVLRNPDLRLRSNIPNPALTEEQEERMLVIFDILISLFERAYLIAYSPDMSEDKARRWNSWEDFMREWCRREEFFKRLPVLLSGEDKAFAQYIMDIANEERAAGNV